MCHIWSFFFAGFPPPWKIFKCNRDAVSLERFVIFNLLVKAIAVETLSTNFWVNQQRMICLWTRKCKNEEFSTREKPFRWRLFHYVYYIYFAIQRKKTPAHFIEVAQEDVSLRCDRIQQDFIKRNAFSCHSACPTCFKVVFIFVCAKFENAFNS